MRNKMERKDGSPTDYALSCGYVAVSVYPPRMGGRIVKLFKEHGVYHVCSCNADRKSFRTRTEAEFYARYLARTPDVVAMGIAPSEPFGG